MNDILELIKKEKVRQADQLSLIASENHVSQAVLEALGSVLTNKYAEGYPGNRYYAGTSIVDQIELQAIQQAQELFSTDYHVNVQPSSGSPANLASYMAVLKPGDTILAMRLSHGGHLTHGSSVSVVSSLYNFIHYEVSEENELIDYSEVERLATVHRPQMIIAGATAYPALLDFEEFSRIAKKSGALLLADISHIAGLIVGKIHPSPFGLADIITSSTHKTLRGPRGGVIFSKPEYATAVDKAVFPGLQGGPLMHSIAAKAIAFSEARQEGFTVYAQQIIKNANALAYRLQQEDFRLVANGTENHMMLVDVGKNGIRGKKAQQLLEEVGIVANMNLLPFDPYKATDPSGLRLGVAAVTSRGMKEKEMELLGTIISSTLSQSEALDVLKKQVLALAKKFPIPHHY